MKVFGKEYKIVSEKDQKNKSNTLYLYVEKIGKKVYAKLLSKQFGNDMMQRLHTAFKAN